MEHIKMQVSDLVGTTKIRDGNFIPYGEQQIKKFTPRETDIIKLVCKQYTDKEIASLLRLSIRTVESHRENIQEKVGARNSIGVVIYAIKYHIYEI